MKVHTMLHPPTKPGARAGVTQEDLDALGLELANAALCAGRGAFARHPALLALTRQVALPVSLPNGGEIRSTPGLCLSGTEFQVPWITDGV